MSKPSSTTLIPASSTINPPTSSTVPIQPTAFQTFRFAHNPGYSSLSTASKVVIIISLLLVVLLVLVSAGLWIYRRLTREKRREKRAEARKRMGSKVASMKEERKMKAMVGDVSV
jgi:flagellar biosynthesis/type III secretory pathway M-ring protein FliF/YscJ